MRNRIAIVYNEPGVSEGYTASERKAVFGVLEAVHSVRLAWIKLGYAVETVPLTPPLEKTREVLHSLDANLVFNLFEGFPGKAQTEAAVAKILAEIGLPFTGCPAPALQTALDKPGMKKLLLFNGIPAPDFQLLSPQKLNVFRLKFPCIVKPSCEDASHGITAESVVHDFTALAKQVRYVSGLYGGQALVESYISGREFNATVLGNSRCIVLPVSEIVFSLPAGMPPILTYDAKWETDTLYYKNTEAVCPAVINRNVRAHIEKIALAAFQLLGCAGYARVDMRMDEENRLFVIEVNPNPDISSGAGAARQAAAAGMSYTRFIHKIILLCLEKDSYDSKNKTRSAGR